MGNTGEKNFADKRIPNTQSDRIKLSMSVHTRNTHVELELNMYYNIKLVAGQYIN
jgi:hypothetical protein